MKKGIIITAAGLIGLATFGFINKEEISTKLPGQCAPPVAEESTRQDLVKVEAKKAYYTHEFGTRFYTTISRTDLHKAKTILDILPRDETRTIWNYKNVEVGVYMFDEQSVAIGEAEVLTADQLALLKTASYSNDFFINADCQRLLDESEATTPYELSYQITVVPEHQASYEGGRKGFLEHMENKVGPLYGGIDNNELKPARLRFSVMQDGTVGKVQLEVGCGFDGINNAALEAVQNTPGNWNIATDQDGNPVEQEFMFFFGVGGC